MYHVNPSNLESESQTCLKKGASSRTLGQKFLDMIVLGAPTDINGSTYLPVSCDVVKGSGLNIGYKHMVGSRLTLT